MWRRAIKRERGDKSKFELLSSRRGDFRLNIKLTKFNSLQTTTLLHLIKLLNEDVQCVSCLVHTCRYYDL